jgi:hypothetical protein
MTIKIRKIIVPNGTDGDGGTESVSSEEHMGYGSASSGLSLSSSHLQCPDFDTTVNHFAVAMNELHRELRDKIVECEAMYETAWALSEALKESDRLLQDKTLECERLQLKLQMVTFIEADDDPLDFLKDDGTCASASRASLMNDVEEDGEGDEFKVPRRPGALLDDIDLKKRSKSDGAKQRDKMHVKDFKKKASHASNKIATGKSPVPNVETISEDEVFDTIWKTPENLNDATTDKMSEPTKGIPTSTPTKDPIDGSIFTKVEEQTPSLVNKGPVCVDECVAEEKKDDFPSSGPRQVHFYNIILERDRALQSAKRYSRELRNAQKKIKDLSKKLECSTALNELTYDEKEAKRKGLFIKTKDNVDAGPITKVEACLKKDEQDSCGSPRASIRVLPWRRNNMSNSQSKITNDELLNFVEEAEMSVSESIAKQAIAERKYLKAIAKAHGNSDADRAAGGADQIHV